MSALIHLPRVNLSRHGLNDFHEPKYRVIWALSRIITISDGIKQKTFPMYATDHLINPIGPFWILEAWQSCVAATGGLTEEQWSRDPKTAHAPYPSRGDYYHCHTFDIQPNSGAIARVISWIEAGRQRRPIENALAIRADMEAEERNVDSILEARIRDRMIPWAAQPVSSRGFSKGTKTAPQLLTAEETGLSVGGLGTRRMRKGYRIPVGRNGVIRKSRVVVP